MRTGLLIVKLLVLINYLTLIGCGSSNDSSEPDNSPSLSFNADQTTIDPGQTVNLSWSAANVDSCTASGDWSGTKLLSGSETSVSLTFDGSFILVCDGDDGSISETVNVTINGTPGTKPLIQESDLVYQGAFRLPVGASDQTSFAFNNATGMAFNPANNSLFMVGHVFHQLSAEVSIPTVTNSTSLGDLATATLLQPFADISDGNRLALGAGRVYIGGQMVYGDRLIGSAYNQDDPDQIASHFTSEQDLSIAGDFQGFYTVGTLGPKSARFVSGYMTQIPQEWQASFGGPAITGGCCNWGATNVNGMSWGPSAFVFDPDDLGVNSPAPATPLVYYSNDHPTLGTWGNTTVANPAFNLFTHITGVVFPEGTRTVLFFGGTGTGIPCIGNGTNDPNLDHQPNPGLPGTFWCHDPLEVNGGTGPHAFPYAYQVWAYDVDDLLAARNGHVDPWDVVPYGVWTLSLPFDNEPIYRFIFGAAYDAATDRIFIAQIRAETDGRPIIHVLSVSK